jgi:small subunit ribosomal protein S6
MNHYETIFIVDPDTQDTDQELIFTKIKDMIAKDGTLIMFDDWGVKKLAYEIKKKIRGRFVRLDYCGNGDLVDAIERLFRLDYRILKFMTSLLGTDVDPESLIIEEDEPEAEAKAKVEVKTAKSESKPESKADAPASEDTADTTETAGEEEVTQPETAGEEEVTQPETETETETKE